MINISVFFFVCPGTFFTMNLVVTIMDNKNLVPDNCKPSNYNMILINYYHSSFIIVK